MYYKNIFKNKLLFMLTDFYIRSLLYIKYFIY